MWSLETPIVVGTITEAVMRTFKVVLLVLLNKECWDICCHMQYLTQYLISNSCFGILGVVLEWIRTRHDSRGEMCRCLGGYDRFIGLHVDTEDSSSTIWQYFGFNARENHKQRDLNEAKYCVCWLFAQQGSTTDLQSHSESFTQLSLSTRDDNIIYRCVKQFTCRPTLNSRVLCRLHTLWIWNTSDVSYERRPSKCADWEVSRLCSYWESLQCKAMFSGHGLRKGCVFFIRALCVSAPSWSTEHYSTCNYSAVWSCPSETSARASILGFPPFHSLKFV